MAVGWILELVWWGIGYAVARLLLPLISLGKVQVAAPLDSSRFGWLGLRRNESGRLEIEATFAALIGLVICCAGLAVILCFIR